MDIVSQTTHNIALLDAVARAALGAACCGVSVGGGRSRVHLMNHNMPEQQRASDALNQFGSLTLSSTSSRLTLGDADPVISCRDELISSDSALAYVILGDEEVIERGQVSLVGGEVSWTLNGLTAGNHDVFLYRLAGNYASGTLRIRVDPA